MKRLLLLSSLVFALALSACGGGNNNNGNNENSVQENPNTKQKAGAGEDCTNETQCKDGLVCVANAGSTDKGKCETACNNGTCSDGKKQCKTDVAGLGGKPVQVCRTKKESLPEEPQPEVPKVGDTCSASKKCGTELVCVTDGTSTEEGTCEKPCDAGNCAEKQECKTDATELGTNDTVEVCQPKPPKKLEEPCSAIDFCDEEAGLVCVPYLGSTENGICRAKCDDQNACTAGDRECLDADVVGSSQTKVCLPAPKLEGARCELTDTCVSGTRCLTKPGSGTVGICTAVKDCSTDETVCDAKAKESCKEGETELGGKPLKVCLKDWCHSNKDCTVPGEKCLSPSSLDLSRGHCEPTCDKNDPDACQAGEKCVEGRRDVDLGAPGDHAHQCLPNAEADKKGFFEECNTTDECRDADKGMVCTARGNGGKACVPSCNKEGLTPECEIISGADLYCTNEDNVKACRIVTDPTKFYTQKEGEECGGLKFCELNGDVKVNLYCKLESKGDSTGKCVKVEGLRCGTFDTGDCTAPEVCTTVIEEGFSYPYRHEEIKVCKK